MRVIVTRPQREAVAWCEALARHGFDVVSLPLIGIVAVADTSAVQAAGRDLHHYAAVMCVSAAAVEHFFSIVPQGQAVNPRAGAAPRFWGTGPGTRAALLRHGVEGDRIDTPLAASLQFDSEALWGVVQGQVHALLRVLIVRGGDEYTRAAVTDERATPGNGREWFAQRLSEAGAQVEFVQAYVRAAPVLDPTQAVVARNAASDGSLWLFTSAQAVQNLRSCLPGQAWQAARALATHARIADAARAAGFGVVRESRPGIADVVASIESIG